MILEIQFGEGGEDSKLFVSDLYNAYSKYAKRLGFKIDPLESSNGHIKAVIEGVGVDQAFEHESGKHCIQRVPPTETKGRVQTSIVSVAILPVKQQVEIVIEDKDLEITTQGGHGPGGQHQNKTESAVRMKHIPTGIEVFINGREQHSNKRKAFNIIKERVTALYQETADAEYNEVRKVQRDGGGRANKIRTYNFVKDRAVDHRFNVKCGNVKTLIEKGRFDRLLKKIKE